MWPANPLQKRTLLNLHSTTWNWYNITALPVYSYIWYLLICFDLLAFSYHSKTVFSHTLFPPQSPACTVPAGPSQINLWYFFSFVLHKQRAPSISVWNWLCSSFQLFLVLFSAPHPTPISSGHVCVCAPPSRALPCISNAQRGRGVWGQTSEQLCCSCLILHAQTHRTSCVGLLFFGNVGLLFCCCDIYIFFLSASGMKNTEQQRKELPPFHSSAKQFNWLKPISEMISNWRNQSCCLRLHTQLGLHWTITGILLTSLWLQGLCVKVLSPCADSNIACAALSLLEASQSCCLFKFVCPGHGEIEEYF